MLLNLDIFMNQLGDLGMPMAGDKMIFSDVAQFRFYLATMFNGKRATGMETTAIRRIQWTGHIAFRIILSLLV